MSDNNPSEIGGAQALLSLGSKGKADDSGNDLEETELNQDDQSNTDQEDYDSKAANQQLNDAVEAAVMRYVGGSLDSSNNSSQSNTQSRRGHKRKSTHDELINNLTDFNQWSGFLDEDGENISGEEDYSYDSQKKKKQGDVGQSDIDPELATLGSEHDSLVEAAILDARELARHLHGSSDLGENQHSHQRHIHTVNGVTPQQAQQVLAAANAAVQQGQAEAQNSDSVSSITQLAQAASSFSSDLGHRKKLGKSEPDRGRIPKSKHDYNFGTLTDIDALIADASGPAVAWFEVEGDPNTRGPRIFSSNEIDAVEHFINGYCHMHNWSREDICNRIWSNERKKDKFWESLTRVLPYRSRASVYKHVRRQYHIFEVRAKWTKEDDNTLKRLAIETECKWKNIGSIMERMPEDCRDRWRNYVKCGENRSMQKWSVDEENSLRDIVADMIRENDSHGNEVGKDASKFGVSGINWTEVSERMKGVRSRIQCRYKWTKLLKKESLARTEYMSPIIKSWLIQKVHQYHSGEDIDWGYIHHLYTDEFEAKMGLEDYNWLASDFQSCFEKMKSEVKGHKKLSLHDIIMSLLGNKSKLQGRKDGETDGVRQQSIQQLIEANSRNHHIGNNSQLDLLQGSAAHLSPLPQQEDQKSQHQQDSSHEEIVESTAEAKPDAVHDYAKKEERNDPSSIANAAVAAISSVEAEVSRQEYSLWR